MYSAPYGYPNIAAATGPPPAVNGAPHTAHHPQHMPPDANPHTPQQIMYNQQQFPMTAGAQFGQFPPSPNSAMMNTAAGPAGVMHTTAVPPNMAMNGQVGYHAPLTSSPYGGPGIPSPAPPQAQMMANYMMPNGQMPAGPISGQLPSDQMAGTSMSGTPMHGIPMSSGPAPGGSMPSVSILGGHPLPGGGGMTGAMPNAATPAFHMTPGSVGSQQPMFQQQRMHPSQPNPAGMSTPQRTFSHPQAAPPNNVGLVQQSQGQFSPPPVPLGTPQSQSSKNPPAPPSNAVTTPQTPTFPTMGQMPPGSSATSSASIPPQSPGMETRDKERFAILLEINQELLYEAIQLQNTKTRLRKEHDREGPGGDAAAASQDGELSEEEKLIQRDYTHCMRRLHSNLTYMAAIADRKNHAQVPPGPAYLRAPPLSLGIRMKMPSPVTTPPDQQPLDPNVDREERDRTLEGLYQKLQALFPGVDPRKEPAFGMPHPPPPQARPASHLGPPQRTGSVGGGAANHESPSSSIMMTSAPPGMMPMPNPIPPPPPYMMQSPAMNGPGV